MLSAVFKGVLNSTGGGGGYRDHREGRTEGKSHRSRAGAIGVGVSGRLGRGCPGTIERAGIGEEP